MKNVEIRAIKDQLEQVIAAFSANGYSQVEKLS